MKRGTKSASLIETIGTRFIDENRPLLQRYRVEHLAERTKILLRLRSGHDVEGAFEECKHEVCLLLENALKSESNAFIPDAFFESVLNATVLSGTKDQAWEMHERMAMVVCVLIGEVERSNAYFDTEQRATVLNAAEKLCQAACFLYMEWLFPGRYADLERLAELATLTGFGAVAQAFDGRIPEAMRPVMQGLFVQPGFLDNAKAAVMEIQGLGKKHVESPRL